MNAKVKLSDIAKRENVSPSTVSNALNGGKGMNEETYLRIIRAAQEMGYVRKKKNAATGQFVHLVILKRYHDIPDNAPVYTEMIQTISRECKKNDLQLMISYLFLSDELKLSEDIRMINEEKCRGIILLASEWNTRNINRFAPAVSPIVVLNHNLVYSHFHCVTINYCQAGYMGTMKLLEAGHRSIGHITVSIVMDNTIEQYQGYTWALREYGMTPDQAHVIHALPGVEQTYRAVRQYLEECTSPLPTAFYAADDEMAAGAVRAFHEAGYRIPEDISIVGTNDLNQTCYAIDAPLSTVHVDLDALAKSAFDWILSPRKGKGIKQLHDVCFVERASICPPTHAKE
ncbi:MAG: LacI family DNA-binding transcriptional regulator [Aristaeellaceae bacterium]